MSSEVPATPVDETVYQGAIGIDLGTTYSCVGWWVNERVEIIANDQGNRTTPSYVAFTESERLIGDAAKNQAAMNPRQTVFDAKRLIGRRYDDPDVKKDMQHWPFTVIDKDGSPFIEVNYLGETKQFSPQEISSMVLTKMKEIAEAKIGKESINPDEAVAYGAAVQAAVLTNQTSDKTADLLLLDVAPLSLGVAMQGDVFGVVVPRNTPIPCNKTRVFTTVEDNQTQVTFPVYEGERTQCKDNRLLGEFELTGIPPQPRGQAELLTTFEIDANGLLKVSAQEKITGRKANITITNSVGRLSSNEIEQMIKDAETFSKADKDFTAKHDAKNDLEAYVHSVEETISSPAANLKRPAKIQIEQELTKALELLEVQDASADEYRRASLRLKRSMQKAFGGR
ncbi:hypothetical protein PaG_03450 [Moesziomyces aphidis]|uniref:non-chaperonin molecular chaperone ATPase n=1 Tax=Moesziomyces aphidis TaxID=84754 RepID=W3VLI0_MOEAP|nr:hypothetical protein PaG_03450 [Moesziomyces aphidis]